MLIRPTETMHIHQINQKHLHGVNLHRSASLAKSHSVLLAGESSEDPSVAETVQGPKDILVAAKIGNLEYVQRYVSEGQTEMTDLMGEVFFFIILS